LCEARRERPQAFAPMRQRECELVRQRCREATSAVRQFTKVASREHPIFQQIEQKCIHVGSHRLHGIECERIAVPLICVKAAHLWIAAGREQCEPRFRLQACKKIVALA
jgi:hypothetical protein